MTKLLLITNDLILARSIKEQFALRGFDTTIVSDSKQGLFYAEKLVYPLIVVDNIMPAGGAESVISTLRHKGRELPIMLIAKDNSTDTVVESFNLGVDDLISRPVRVLEFEARALRLLWRPPVSKNEIVHYRDVKIDLSNNQVERRGFKIKLTRKERELLSFMIVHKNHLVTREKILANIWGTSTDLKENTVDCYMSSLRRKLEKGYKHKFFHTEYGMGYMFVPPV